MKILTHIALILVLVGALNWGLVGWFDWNLVSFLFGEMSFFSRLIYGLVGLSSLWIVFDWIYGKGIKE